jgi:hypothetical protein
MKVNTEKYGKKRITLHTVPCGFKYVREYACFAGTGYEGEGLHSIAPTFGRTRLEAAKLMIQSLAA